MKERLTLDAMRLLIAELRAKAIKPCILNSQEEVDAANAMQRSLGLSLQWRLGDHYYRVADFL